MTVDEFAQDFFQEVVGQSDAEGKFAEDVFFERFCEHLTDAGEIETADRAAFAAPRGGIRVDGYGGDPTDSDSGTFSLIVSDFHQARETGRLVETEMNAIFRRLLNFLRKALDPDWRNALEETSPAFGLADLIAQRWNKIDKVRFFLISNRELSDRVDRRDAEELDERTVTYSVWDIRRLHRFATMGHGREDIDIDLERDFGGALAVLPAQQAEAGHESYLAVVPGPVLANIYDRWGTRLLEQNVRVFLQARGKVNKGIRKTLETEPAMFFAYNNGITATAEEIAVDEAEGRLLLRRLKNFQIVNGGQTTASIHVAHRGKVDLSRLFVQMKLSVVDSGQAEAIVPKISEYANSQNRVNAADFFANHPFHIRLEEFSRRIYAPPPDGTFRQSKWFYERARGQYADARALLTAAGRKKFDLENPRSQLFSKTDLAKFLNVWDRYPHRVSLGAQKNFALFAKDIGGAWQKYPDRFNEGWYREAVAKAIVFRACEKIVSGQPWYRGGYRANIVAYAIAKMAHDVGEMKCAVDFQSVWDRQAPGDAMESGLVRVAEAVHQVLVDPPPAISNVTEWAKKQACWDRASRLEIEWPEEFLADLISIDEKKAAAADARREHRQLEGIEAQISVTEAGGEFWAGALAWGRKRKLLTHAEAGILELAAQTPRKVPSEAQSERAVKTLRKLQDEGYDKELA